jgi:hypothetical protein
MRNRSPPATPTEMPTMTPIDKARLVEVEVGDVDPVVAVDEVAVLVGDVPGNGG